MLIGDSLPFIRDYIQLLNENIRKESPESGLTRIQCYWLSFVIMGLLLTNSLCWKRFERYSVGDYTDTAISWMFRRSKIAWECLLRASTLRIIEQYKITQGVLVIDDTDRERSKNTTQIGKVHKIKDKKSGGYFNGQNIIFLLLVSKEITIPVGFEFHQPDPALSAWNKSDKALRKKKVSKNIVLQNQSRIQTIQGKRKLL